MASNLHGFNADNDIYCNDIDPDWTFGDDLGAAHLVGRSIRITLSNPKCTGRLAGLKVRAYALCIASPRHRGKTPAPDLLVGVFANSLAGTSGEKLG